MTEFLAELSPSGIIHFIILEISVRASRLGKEREAVL